MYLLCYYFKLFGNGPIGFKFVKNSKDSRLVFHYSKIGVLHNVISSAVLSIVVFLYYYDGFELILGFLNYELIITAFGSVLILLIFSYKSRDLISITDQINMITSQKLIGETIVINNAFIIIFTLAIDILINYYRWNYFSTHLSFSKNFVRILVKFWCKSVINSVLLQFSVLLHLIKKYIESINNNIVDVLKHNNRLLHTRYINILSIRLKFHKLMESHGILCDLSQEISNYYSLQLLFCIAIIFTCATKNLYIFLKHLILLNEFNRPGFFQNFILIFSLFLLTTRVTAVLNEVF